MPLRSTTTSPTQRVRALHAAVIVVAGLAAAPLTVFGQGCMPIRFTSPSLTAQNGAALAKDQWEMGVVYRRLYADQLYVGHKARPDLLPGGEPLVIRISTAEFHIAYAPTSRFSINLGVPFAVGSHSRIEDDGLRHRQDVSGLGDVSLVGTLWLLEPQDRARGNVALGFGIKAPTGESNTQGPWRTASGTERKLYDPSIQLGDGGWGFSFHTRAFRQLFRRTAAYVGGTYLSHLRGRTDAMYDMRGSYGVVPLAITDEYSAHAGLAFDALPRSGLSASLGGRIDGIPVRNLVGGSDDSFRRPGYAVYVEPAISLNLSRSQLSPSGSTISLSVPITVDRNRKANTIESLVGKQGAGDFTRFLVFLGYSKRF